MLEAYRHHVAETPAQHREDRGGMGENGGLGVVGGAAGGSLGPQGVELSGAVTYPGDEALLPPGPYAVHGLMLAPTYMR